MTEQERLELEFLRWFYDAAGDVFGPADSDVYYGLKEDFVREMKLPLPGGYEL